MNKKKQSTPFNQGMEQANKIKHKRSHCPSIPCSFSYQCMVHGTPSAEGSAKHSRRPSLAACQCSGTPTAPAGTVIRAGGGGNAPVRLRAASTRTAQSTCIRGNNTGF
eukprot:1158533-Pelagomonas_calceolata.AAC.14